MNAKRIMCPIDFSEYSDAALRYASSLAQEAGAKLYLVHVDDSQVPYDAGYAAYIAPPSNPEVLQQRLEEKRPSIEGVEYEHKLLFGHPADGIVEFAQEHDVDLIVLGTHGRTGVARLLMGSIAEAVVRRAPCPVLTVKMPMAAAVSTNS
jgi:nucleotide-binding universal stress UspA family protein